MKLAFEGMVVRNFRTFLGKHTFGLAEGGPGLYFMRGKNKLEPSLEANDAGKSTLWDAFCWCLYGRTIGGLRGPDIKPWGSSDDTVTSVMVSVHVDGERHEISRAHNPNSLKLNGDSCGQEHIDRLLQMSHWVASHTILMGQGQPLFFDLPPRDALSLFVECLDLNRWDVRSKFSSEEVTRLELKLAKYQGELRMAKGAIETGLQEERRAKNRSQEWAGRWGAAKKDLEIKLKAAKDEHRKQSKLKGDADLAYDGAGTELKAIQEEINGLRASYDTAVIKRTKYESLIEGHRKAKTYWERELGTLGNTDRCPTCNQKVTGTNLDKHKKELRGKISELNREIEKGVPVAITKEVDAFKRSIEQAREGEASFKTKEADALSTLRRIGDSVARADADVRHLAARIKENEDAANVYHEQYIRLKKNNAQLKADIKEIDEDISRTAVLIARTQPWIKGFKDIRLHTIEDVLKELEFVTNAKFAEIGLKKWQVKYDVEKETKSGTIQHGLNVSIMSPRNEKPVSWKCWGGGVGQRLRIAGALSLSEVLLNHAGVACNVEVLDEPARHMTRGGVRGLCNYLAQRAIDTGKTIWFIDHAAIESDKFSDVATVVKDENGSRIVWG